MRRVSTLKKREANLQRLKSGCETIDRLFNNEGLFPRGIYEIYGLAGVGKTQFILQYLSVNYPSVYICTEGAAASSRLREIIQAKTPNSDDTSKVLDNILISEATCISSFWDLIDKQLPRLCKQQKIKLVVIDSITNLFRSGIEFKNNKSDTIDRSVWLFNLSAKLKEISHLEGFPVLVTNQVSSNLKTGTIVPALGLSWSQCIDTRLCLTKEAMDENHRKIRIIFSNLFAEGEETFLITKNGICSS